MMDFSSYDLSVAENFQGFVDPKDPRNPFECCIWRDLIDYVFQLMQVVSWLEDPI